MITSEEAIAIHRAMSRVMSHLMGTRPELVWANYGTFEDDTSILVDILGVLEDTAKPYLETRQRELVQPSAIAPAASSHLSLDGGLAIQVAGDGVIKPSRGRR